MLDPRLWRAWRPVSFPGAGLQLFSLLLLIPALGLGACGPPVEIPDPEVEGARALGLEGGARLYRITLGGRGSEEHAVPARVVAAPGDAVEFVTVDHRVHVVRFLADSLSPESHAFLDATGQLSIPPLVSRGSRHVVRLEGAPPGRYPFVAQGHGGSAGGLLVVTEAGPSLLSGDS